MHKGFENHPCVVQFSARLGRLAPNRLVGSAAVVVAMTCLPDVVEMTGMTNLALTFDKSMFAVFFLQFRGVCWTLMTLLLPIRRMRVILLLLILNMCSHLTCDGIG